MAGIRGRFAPSPTGSLHLGNARTALAAWLHTRSRGGTFVMRVEDLDRPRTVPQAVLGNLKELRWLGLDWDEGPDIGGPLGPYRQSQRDSYYQQALELLCRQGLLFPCYLSRREVREVASAPHGRTPVYGRREQLLNQRLSNQRRTAGLTPSLRVRVPARRIAFDDLLAGPQVTDLVREVGDLVVRRADGLWAYQLAVVVDDIAMGITEVVRGDDLLISTAAQLWLYEVLEGRPPTFLHLPLLLDEAGKRLAKRRGSLTLTALMAEGVTPERVVGLLAHSLGLTEQLQPLSAAEALTRYHPKRLRRTAAMLAEAHLGWLRDGGADGSVAG